MVLTCDFTRAAEATGILAEKGRYACRPRAGLLTLGRTATVNECGDGKKHFRENKHQNSYFRSILIRIAKPKVIVLIPKKGEKIMSNPYEGDSNALAVAGLTGKNTKAGSGVAGVSRRHRCQRR
jgi:hypothetical protein